jgi:ABC-type sugar transport system permease subunit
MGYASTISLVVFLVVMVVTLLQLRLSRYWVNYD